MGRFMRQLMAKRAAEARDGVGLTKKGECGNQTPPAVMTASKRRFLEQYLNCGGSNSLTAKTAGVSERTVHKWLRDDPEFKVKVDELKPEAYERACDAHEVEADRRGVDGVLQPVYQGGELVGHIRKYSDKLLILRLKALMPEKYAERPQHRGTVKHEYVMRILEQMRPPPDGPAQAPGRAEPG